MSRTDEMINKSLDEIDAIIKGIEDADNDLNKSELPPDQISQDTPEEGQEPSPEYGEEGGEYPEEGQEPTEEEEEDTDEVPTEEDEYTEKSLRDELVEDEGIKKSLEVSEFLTALVDGISSKLMEHNSNINKSLDSNRESGELLAKSFDGIVKSQKAVLQSHSNLQKSITELKTRIDSLEKTPTVRKSVATSHQIIEKSFAGEKADTNKNALTKSQALEKLTVEFNNNPTLASDILALESVGDMNVLSPQAKSILGI